MSSNVKILIQPVLFLITILSFQCLFAQSSKDIECSGIQLTGKINNKYPIEVHLSGNDLDGFFDFDSDDCHEIEGDYYYRSQIKPISVKGKICSGKNIVLTHSENGEETERFVGKWDKQKASINGSWTMLSTGKAMPFELSGFSHDFNKGESRTFLQLLRKQLVTEAGSWGGYQYAIEDVKWSSSGGVIKDFEAADGTIEHFSKTRLVFEHNYSNAGNGTDTREVFQLLPSKKGIYALYHIQNYSRYSLEEEEDEACDFAFALYQWQHLEWVEIDLESGVKRFPKGFLVIGNKCSDGEPVVLSDCVRIGKQKFDWNEDRFVLRASN